MKQRTLLELLVFVGLVGSCAAVRVALQDLPNFAPVAAVALFAGYFFRSGVLALCVPLSAMALSDLFIGGYHWQMMLTVYAMLALPVAARGSLRRYWQVGRDTDSAWRPFAGLMTCSLAASVLFFLTTNFGCWLWFTLYEHSLSGLVHCYVQALPFFRYTLAGDLVFASVLFGGHAIATQWLTSRATAAVGVRG